MTEPYYVDDLVTLYHGRFEDLLPELGLQADLIVTDPPYGETNLSWDRWPDGWPTIAADYAPAMWCFGSFRMFWDRRDEFDRWKLSQDANSVWEKHNGSNFATDRFRRVHEHVVHFYQGAWRDIRHVTPTTADAVAKQVRRKTRPAHLGDIGVGSYTSTDGGPRLMPSVMYARSMHGRAINGSEKPVEVVTPLVEYGCPPGGLVLDLFAGSCSTLLACRALGIRAVGFEEREDQCESAVRHRLGQQSLDLTAGGVQ